MDSYEGCRLEEEDLVVEGAARAAGVSGVLLVPMSPNANLADPPLQSSWTLPEELAPLLLLHSSSSASPASSDIGIDMDEALLRALASLSRVMPPERSPRGVCRELIARSASTATLPFPIMLCCFLQNTQTHP